MLDKIFKRNYVVIYLSRDNNGNINVGNMGFSWPVWYRGIPYYTLRERLAAEQNIDADNLVILNVLKIR